MTPGYLRKNGVPYSAAAILTEYFAQITDDDGTRYLTVTTMLDDPTYLQQPWGPYLAVPQTAGCQGLESHPLLGPLKRLQQPSCALCSLWFKDSRFLERSTTRLSNTPS